MCYMHTHVYTHGIKVYFKWNILGKSSQMSPIPSNAVVYSELLFPECVLKLTRAMQGIQATLVLMLHLQCGCIKANKHRDGIQHLLSIKMMSWVFSRGKLERDLYSVFYSGRVKDLVNWSLLNCLSGHLVKFTAQLSRRGDSLQRKQVCMLVTSSHKGKEVAAIASPPRWNRRALQMAMAAPMWSCEDWLGARESSEHWSTADGLK